MPRGFGIEPEIVPDVPERKAIHFATFRAPDSGEGGNFPDTDAVSYQG